MYKDILYIGMMVVFVVLEFGFFFAVLIVL
jgi:hypothetical protein